MFLCFYLQTSLSSAPGRPSTIWSFTSWLSTVSSEPVTFPSSSVQLRPLPVLFSKPPGHRLHVDHSYFYNRINTQNSNIYKNGKTTKNQHKKKNSIWLSIPLVSFLSRSPRTLSAQTIEQRRSSQIAFCLLRKTAAPFLCSRLLFLLSLPVFFWNTKHTEARQPLSE